MQRVVRSLLWHFNFTNKCYFRWYKYKIKTIYACLGGICHSTMCTWWKWHLSSVLTLLRLERKCHYCSVRGEHSNTWLGGSRMSQWPSDHQTTSCPLSHCSNEPGKRVCRVRHYLLVIRLLFCVWLLQETLCGLLTRRCCSYRAM